MVGWVLQSAVLVFGSALLFVVGFVYYQYWKTQKRKPDSTQESETIEEDKTRKDEARLQMRLNSIKMDMDQLGVNYIEDTFVEGVPVQFHLPDHNLVILTDPSKSTQFSNHETRVLEGPQIADKTGDFIHALYNPEEVINSTTTKEDLEGTDLSEEQKMAFAEFGIDGSDISYSDKEELQSEIRRKMKAVHPDNVPDSKEWSIQQFQEKKDAYDVLKEEYF